MSPLYIDRSTLRRNDQAAAAARTQGLVDDVTEQYAAATAPPPEPVSWSIPSLDSLGVTNAPSAVMSAIGAVPKIGQKASEAISWALPSLESLGVTMPKVETPLSPDDVAVTPSGSPSAMPQTSAQPSAPPSASATGAGGEIDNSSRQSFIRTAWPHMLQAAGGNQDAAEMMLAAAISENGSIGTGRPFFGNAFFGIKGCYDETTEVLTSDGWRSWMSVSEHDVFATLNPESGAIEYQRASHLIRYRHVGEMYRVASDRVDLLVTPDHRMWVRPAGSPYQIVRARDLLGRSVEYLTLHEVPSARGCAGISREPVAALHDHVSDVRRLRTFKEMGRAYARRVIASVKDLLIGNQRHIVGDLVGDTVGPKHEVARRSPNQAVALQVDRCCPQPAWANLGAVGGDGSVLVDFRPEASLDGLRTWPALTGGRDGTVRVHRESPSLGVTPRPSSPRRGALRRRNYTASGVMVPFDGMVYCATVPNGLLLVRRNGKAVVSGNSGTAGSVESPTWEQTPNGPVHIIDKFAAYNTPVEGFRAFFNFLENNSRYAPALERYQQTGDATQLFRDVNAAGYATDQQWADKVQNIRENQVAPITRGIAAAAPTAGPEQAGGLPSPSPVSSPFPPAEARQGSDLMVRQPLGQRPAEIEPGVTEDPSQQATESGYGLPSLPQPAADLSASGSAGVGAGAEQAPTETPRSQTPSEVWTEGTGMRTEDMQPGGLTGPAARVYGETVQNAQEEEDRYFRENLPRVKEFAESTGIPLQQASTALRIARDVALATPQATAETFDAIFTQMGFGRQQFGVDVPGVGRVGLADVIELPGKGAVLTSIGVGRAAHMLPGLSQFGTGLAGAVERGTQATVDATGRAITSGAGAVREAASDALEGAGRVIREGRETAARLNAEPQTGYVAPGTLGVVTGSDERMLPRQRVVPPEVADQLDFPLRIPDDPRFTQAVEAAGGRVDPERGADFNVIRYQGPKAHGGEATRDMVFYTAGRPGERSPYASNSNDPNAVGGTDRIEGWTRYRSPLVLSDAPGSREGFDEGMQRLMTTAAEEFAAARENLRRASRDLTALYAHDPESPEYQRAFAIYEEAKRRRADAARAVPSARIIDEAIREARRAGPEGSPARAQALKELLTRFGGNPNRVDGLLKIRGADASESAWAIKENIISAHARRAGYDGIITVQENRQGALDLLEQQIQEHPDWVAQKNITDDLQWQFDQMYREHSDAVSRGSRTESSAAYERMQDLAPKVAAADRKLQNIHDRLLDELPMPPASKITELADVREARNPTPGAPHPRVVEAENRFRELQEQLARETESARAERRSGITPSRETLIARGELVGRVSEAERALKLLKETPDVPPGPPGYTLRDDLPRRAPAEAASETATATPGASIGRGSGVLDAINRDIGSAIGTSTFGAASGMAAPADSDEERRRNALTGAGIGLVAGPLASRAVRSRGGALATLGPVPSGPGFTADAAKVSAEAARGAQRGARLNRAIEVEGSRVPAAVRAATQLTDDRAAMRWAEDVLGDAAGSPRLAENSAQRASTQSRVNPDSISAERIADELTPVVAQAKREGVLDELSQLLEDVHQRDVLADFYQRGRQEALDAGKTEAQAHRDGLLRMKQRAGSNPGYGWEEVNTRLAGQVERLNKSGQGDRVLELAQQVWGHNRKTLENGVESGRITQETADLLAEKYPHYVPTVPLSTLLPDGGSATRAGKPSAARVSADRAKYVSEFDDVGSASDRLNPIIASRNATIVRERQNQRNKVFQRFAQMFDDATMAGAPEATATLGERRNKLAGEVEVGGWVNGEWKSIRVPKPVADMLDAAAGSGSPNAVMDFWGKVVRAVTETITARRAAFAPVNLIRDFGDYAWKASSELGGPQALPKVVGAYASEFGTALLDIVGSMGAKRATAGGAAGAAYGAGTADENASPAERMSRALLYGLAGAGGVGLAGNRVVATGAAERFLKRGGGMASLDAGWKGGERWLRQAERDGGVVVRSPQDLARFMGDVGRDLLRLEPIAAVNERLELVPRAARMKLAEKAGEGATESMIRGRDSTIDFQRAGTLIRDLNRVIPFTNATVQGGAQMVRTLRDHPMAATATLASTLGPLMLGAEAYNRSSPERAQAYNDVPQYLKDTGIVVMLPWAGSDNRGSRPNYLWVPLGAAGSIFAIASRQAMQKLPGVEPAAGRVGVREDAPEWEKWAGVASEVFNVFSPIRGDSPAAMASSIIPPGAKQAVELGTNKSLYSGATIASEMTDERASAVGRGVANAANAAGRFVGSDALQEVRPSQVDYLMRQAPAYGDLIMGASDDVAPSGYKQAEQRDVQNAPVAGGLIGRIVRDTGGANLDRAQNERLSPDVRAALEEAGMRPSELATAPSFVSTPEGRLTLERDEQLNYQEQMNVFLSEELDRAQRSAEYRKDPKAAIDAAITKARQRAAAAVLREIPASVRRDRIRGAEALKAS